MNDSDKAIFEEILKKAEIDKDAWSNFNSDEPTVFIGEEYENEIMERMFLVYYVKKYLELVAKN